MAAKKKQTPRTKRNEVRAHTRARIIELLGGKCTKCGSTENLQFDHIDPTSKDFNISSNLDSVRLWQELMKCQLLCEPHHREKTRQTSYIRPNARGVTHHNSKLRDLDVLYIRGLSELGHLHLDIANEFGVSRMTVGDILNGRTWKHV